MAWWPRAMAAGGVAAFLLCAALSGSVLAQERYGGVPLARRVLTAPFHVIDGDTFEADLDGDGRIDPPGERIRLLYVDTPELSESDKGVDLARGTAARELLAAWLDKGPVALFIPTGIRREKYGRTLGILRVGEQELNLLLVRQGLSYFDTRFNFPEDYDRYAEAEGQAFSERLGIWSDAASRERYLRRLEREWKTPRSAENPLFGGAFSAQEFDWRASQGKYVRLTGRMILADGTLPQSVQVHLETPEGRERVRGVLFYPLTERLRPTRWPPGSSVVLEGFVRGYRNRPAIIIHYAATLPRLARAGGAGAPAGSAPGALQFGAPVAMMNGR